MGSVSTIRTMFVLTTCTVSVRLTHHWYARKARRGALQGGCTSHTSHTHTMATSVEMAPEENGLRKSHTHTTSIKHTNTVSQRKRALTQPTHTHTGEGTHLR